MKIPKDILDARREFRSIRRSPKYKDILEQYYKNAQRPWFVYRHIKAKPDEVLISLHDHSDGIDCSLEDIARRGAEAGYKIIGVTNHNSDQKFSGERVLYFDFGSGIYLVKGKENRCIEDATKKDEGKDIILIGYENHVDPFMPIEKTLDSAKKNKGIIIVTSGFNRPSHGFGLFELDRYLEYFDAIETMNPCSGLSCFNYSDILSIDFARKNSLAGIYGDDAHTLDEIGLAGWAVKKDVLPFLDDAGFIKDSRVISDHGRAINNADVLVEGIRNILYDPQMIVSSHGKPMEGSKGIFNYGNFMPKLSLMYPIKFPTLSHKHAVLQPY